MCPKSSAKQKIPQSQKTLNHYEAMRRSVNQGYQDAIEHLKTFRKRTVCLDEFKDYAHAAIAAYNIIQAENIREEKLTLKFRIGIQRKQAIDQLAREFVTSFLCLLTKDLEWHKLMPVLSTRCAQTNRIDWCKHP